MAWSDSKRNNRGSKNAGPYGPAGDQGLTAETVRAAELLLVLIVFVFLPGLVIPAGISAGYAGHGGNGPVPEFPEPIRESAAVDQGTTAGQDEDGSGKAAYTAEYG